MSLLRVGFIPVAPGAEPGFDHADVYQPGRRMYVAHTGADRVDVLDCEQLTFLRSLPDLPGVAGVLVDEEHDLLFTSDRDAARVSVFRCSDETLLGRVDVGAHPNGLAYDRRRPHLYAFNLGEPLGENCTASIVDLADERFDAPEAPGLDVLMRGLSMVRDDDELLALSGPLFDGLYEYRKRALLTGREPS